MREIKVVRDGQQFNAPLSLLYPNVVGIPLSAYLLHEDAKASQAIEFQQQTAELVGSQQAVQQTLVDCFGQSIHAIEQVGEQIVESNRLLSEIDRSLSEIHDDLGEIKFAVFEVEAAVRTAAVMIAGAIERANAQLAKLNNTAVLIAKLIESPELTWARERALTASRAMQVGDLALAEQAALHALDGNGTHTGSPTHVELMLLLAEVRMRIGVIRLADIDNILNRAQLYLSLESTGSMQARYHFDRGSYLLLQARHRHDISTYKAASQHFSTAAKEPAYSCIGHIYVAVADSGAGVDPSRIAGYLTVAIVRDPRVAIELFRKPKKPIHEKVILRAVTDAAVALYKKNVFMDNIERVIDRVEASLVKARELYLQGHSVDRLLSSLSHFLIKLNQVRDIVRIRVKRNNLLSAFLLARDRVKFDRLVALSRGEIEAWKS